MSAQQDRQQTLRQIKSLMQASRFEQTAALATRLLEAHPDDKDGLYFLAVSHRYLEQPDSAQTHLDRLLHLFPDFGRSWQEQGHLSLSRGQRAEARQAFHRAVILNDSLLASWRALAGLAADGDPQLADVAREQVRRLVALPPELLGVRNLMIEGKLLKAENLCRSFLQKNPRHVEAMRLLADLGVRSGVLDDAEFILDSALVFEPNNQLARFDYMNVLYQRQKYAASLAQAKALLNAEPDSDKYRTAYANQCVAVGDFDTALESYAEILARYPENAGIYLVQGHALKTVGQLEAAIESYRSAYRSQPDFGDAYWSLANLKTYRFSDDELNCMQRHEQAAGTSMTDGIHLCFALGKGLEDRAEFEQSAGYYLRGNELKRQELQYDASHMSRRLSEQQAFFTADQVGQLTGRGNPAPDPVFIVGLPRAGSTLLEQILASHSSIDGTLELQHIPALAHRLDGRHTVHEAGRYPAILSELSDDKLQGLGQQYLDESQIHREQAPLFLDKMPNNFRHIGLIHAVLPNARIIDARRHPMACCFSGFKQLFAAGQEFTYGLTEIGQYYRDYVALMDHWDTVLPGKILRVHYESVVADTETQVRKILDFLDLPFESACLNFHETRRSVRTPSSEQVRQPIYTSGLAQWRHFEPWLDPLKAALGPILDRYPVTELP